MSSEDKTVEPSDQGPSPPSSSVGATSTESPAHSDKRPRGRPRKDAAAILPQVPPSSTPKNRKKGRTRGRLAIDEEDSMDGSEITESIGTQDTETQILPVEDVEVVTGEVPEQDDPSRPLAQSPPAENSAGPSVPGSREVKSSERLCAFCYCGGHSLLGQGDLQVFSTTPQLEALFIQKGGGGSTSDSSDGDKTTQPKMAGETTSGQMEKTNVSESCEEEPDPASRIWDELSHVGLPQDLKVQSVFESGQCWAHQSCALWSEGVCEGEGQSLLNVDRAIDSGSTKHCAYCKRLGASIKCCAEGCAQHYHYPCAGAAGTFQDIGSLSLLCPEHIELAIDKFVDVSSCALCDSPGDLLDQLFCTSCGQHYHGMCLDMAVTPLRRAGWQCPECKICQTCNNPGEDTKMLVCDMCDKGYHTFCLQPAMDSLPTNGWRCKNCRVCIQCGTRTSGQWHHNSLLCENCVLNQDPALCCATCTCILDPEHHKDLLFCHTCKRWLHLECERQNSGQADIHPREDYVCSNCRSPAAEQALQAEDMDTGPELSPQPAPMHTDSEISLQLAQKHTDLEPGTQHPPEMHNDPKPELLAVPLHSDPEPSQATVQEEELALSAQKPEVSVEADAEKQVTEPSVNESLTELKPETKPAARTQLTSPESPASSSTPCQESESFPTQLSTEVVQTQDTTLQIKPAKTEVYPEQDMATPSTKDFKAITSATKEPSTASVPFTDQPVEVSLPQPSSMDVVRTSFLETAPKDIDKETRGDIFQRNLAETVTPSASSTSEEMDTTPESKPNLSFPSLSSEEKPLKTSVERLAEMVSSPSHSSPLLRGISPREQQHAPALPSLGDHGCVMSTTTTLIPLTPKIGMGKPAITKRKFSPGRPRVKQGAWSPHSSVSSPLSWSPDQSEGWDVPKTRHSSGSPGWSIRVGRGSGFPGRRRPRGAGLSGRPGRGRARGKNGVSPSINPGITTIETAYPIKDEEENAMHNTVVIFSSSDCFTLKQDMCVVCGSFGLGAEGRLLACAQCGQCYHPFCVGIKMNKVVLSKGWRCLECTVCEACGQATDPGRLLLCDDCDISYHTYCLDPPLQNVPKESWKCKWCVSCIQCGATTPGLRCDWQNNYTRCAPCASLLTCPICLVDYSEGTVIVQCRQCDRWFHASCQGLHSDDDVEKAADSSFDCTMCRSFKNTKVVTKARDAIEPVVMTQIVTKAKEMDLSRTYTQDGVCLTESGLCQLQSLSATASRRRKPKPKLKLKIINQNSVAVLQAPVDPLSEHSRDEDMEDNREAELIDCEGKSDSSPEREPAEDDSKGGDGGKKRKRKPYRPGIGGFMVRQRSRPGQGPGKAKRSLCRKDSSGSVSENPVGKDEGWTEAMPDTPVDEIPPGPEIPEKIKKRYRKKKTKLEEAFPAYLQEAFFGKDLLDKSKQSRQKGVESGLLEEGQSHVERKHPTTGFLDPSSYTVHSASSTPLPARPTATPAELSCYFHPNLSSYGSADSSEEPLVDLSDVLNTDADIFGMFGKPSNDSGLDFCPFQVDSSPTPFAGLDIGPLADSSPVAGQSQAGRRTPRTLPEEPLDGILSPELDKMVTDESILSKLYKIPELGGKDVEDLFTAVLSPSTSQPPPPPQVPHPQGPGPLPGTSMPHPNTGNPMFPRMPMINGMMGPNQRFPTNPGAGPCIPEDFSPLNRMPFTDNPRDRQFNQMPREAVGQWPSPGHCSGPTTPGSLPEGETEAMSNAQRSTLKWEKEETLGELATVAPVLYTNVNFPNLKEEYPDWSTRVKQIAKLWRKASSQDRAPYVQKARDNRAALRINKVQMSNETVKRHHPQQQPPEVFDPNIPLDTELLFKDPLKPKESEHEQEWKFRQQMRQKSKQQAKIEATQKLEQVKNEQLQQQQQQQQGTNSQSEEEGNNSGNQSPASLPSNGSMSPMQQMNSKEAFARPQLPGTPTSGPPEDVFLRPPPPPPSGPSSQPQSPQVFSPGSSGSRPSSPWDPYAKMVGTPRPPTLGPNACRRIMESGKSPNSMMEQQDRGRPSPAHESFGSPTSMSNDPYAKPPDTPRPTGDMDPFLKPMGPPRASQAAQGRPPMGSPGRESYSRPMIRNEAYQRMAQNRMILSDPYSRPLLTPIPGSNESGSVPLFKTPMPPPQAQDPFCRSGPHPSDRFSQNQMNDPYAQPPNTPRPSGNDNFTSPPRMGQHHSQGHSFAQPGPITQMSRNPYAHAPSTPRPDHFTYDPFAQPSGPSKQAADAFSQSSVNQRSINDLSGQPRPFFEPYARPPGTPRPHDNYGQPSNTPSQGVMNQFNHQSHPGQRMSPSHSGDPYAQPPGTPRPSMGERFNKSPGSQRGPIEPFTSTPGTSRPGNSDMFAQPGVLRPMLNDPYAQPPGTPRPGPDGLSRQGPRPGPMGSQDLYQPPQGRLQESFVHPGSQTPKHLGLSEDGFSQSPSRRLSQTPVHDPYEQGPMTPHPQSMEKMEMKDHSGVSNNGAVPQDPGQLSNNPHMTGVSSDAQGVALAESEERLRQRLRIRELILKQQQQRSAIRQERGPQDPAGNITPGTPRPWPQEVPGQQGEMFNRPPPPYPGQGPMRGPMRFPGPFPGDQRVSFPNEGQMPRGPHPRDPNMRHQGPRFAYPPGVLGPHGPQEFFPRGQHPMQDVHPQMRRSISAEMANNMGGNHMGLPQHFPQRGMPVQQHNIMGQPFIELRHRAAENRSRMPFPPGAMQSGNIDPNMQVLRPAGFQGAPDSRFSLNQGSRMVDPMAFQTGHLQMSASMDNLHHQAQMSGINTLKQTLLMRSMSQPASNETQNMAASMTLTAHPAGQNDTIHMASSEAVEEKLDTEESAVKDLEDVEVKDLVDADLDNLNLDPEDGKDLDLETNDLHLDDFLTSGKFDIIAYTDPDLDDIKKDMFNDELDLSDPMDDHADNGDNNKSFGTDTEASSTSASGMAKSETFGNHSLADVKLEAPGNQDSAFLAPGKEIKTEVKDCQKAPEVGDQQAAGNTLSSNQQGVLSDSTPVLSSLLIKQQPEEQSLNPIGESVSHGGNLIPQQNQITDTQHTSGVAMSQTMSNDTTAEDSLTGFGAEHQVGLSPGVDQSGLTPAQQAMLSQEMDQHGQLHRPLLLEEQPLLLQDLLDQERQEQQQQRQMQAMIRQRSSDSFFPNIDFDAITDPIMKAKMVALKGINKVMVQNSMGMTPMAMSRFPTVPVPPSPESAPPPPPPPPQAVGQDGKLTPVVRPTPPNFGPGFVNNAQRAQYEEWLQETQQLLQMQQKFLEEKIGAHRKSKKALSAKQRTAKKAGREFPEEDAEQLKHVTDQQGVVQKQLEQIRKQQKEHAELIEEYRVKHQQNNMTPIMPGMHSMPGPAGMVASGPPIVQPPMNPMMQMPPHPSQTNAPPRMPNPPPGWHPGAPMPMGGSGMPPIMPPQVPVANPGQPHQMPMGNLPQHSQMPVEPQAAPSPAGGVKPNQGGGLKFDDNNPFSEGFQERERRERLREQQERQRVQLMQEVERQRALKHRMEMEQQGMMGPDGNMAPLSQMPFFNAELPQDFMQPQRPSLQQQPLGPVFPQQQGAQPGMGSPPGTFMQGERRAMMGNGMMPGDMGHGFGPDNIALQAPNFHQGQPRPRQFSGPGMMLQMPGESLPFDSATPLPSNFPGSGQSLIQLYSNIIPDEKGKKKRNRKKKKDDDADSVKTPSTPHSDLTAPLTPCVSDTSSTPTRNTHLFGDQDLSRSPLLGSSTPSHSELERQLSGGQSGQPSFSSEAARTQALEHDRILNNIKLEQTDASDCHGPIGSEMSSVKEEGSKGGTSPFPAGQSPNKCEAGNELLKHLLKNKSTPPHGFPQQRSEEDDPADCKALLRQCSMDSNGAYSDGTLDFPGPLHPEQEKKKGRNKRAPKGGEKPASRYKKRKKDGDDRQLMHSGPDSVITQIKQQLSLLPLMEPLIGVNFAHFAPFGSGQLNGENLLSGTFGSASLDGVSDYYSQLAYKSNLSNPPTPPASLPPTPPPVNRQKMINGFATTEEMASKAAAMVSKGLVPKPLHVPFKTEEDLLARAIAQGPKTVDVPASLPTPPHNNQEELSNRGQEPCKDRDTPDSFVPSSSPESVFGMEISRYPDLSLVKEEPPSPCLSPVFPMLPAADGKGSEVKLQDIKTEPSAMFFGSPFGPMSNDSKQRLVSVAITLRPAAAENITGVVAAISDLLCLKIPSSYEVSSTPERGPLSMLSGARAGPHGMEQRPPMLFHGQGDNGGLHGRPGQMIRPGGLQGMMQQQQAHHFRFHPNSPGAAVARGPDQRTPASPSCKPQWCCHCKVVVLGNGVQKSIKDMPAHMKESEGRLKSEEDLVFCSHSCFLLYCSSPTLQSRSATETKESMSLLPVSEQMENLSKAQHQYSNNMSSLDVHCLAQLQPKQSPPSTPIPFPTAGETPKFDIKSEAIKVTVKLKSRPRSNDCWNQGKRQKGLRWRKWTVQVVIPRGNSQLPDEDKIDELLKKLGASLRPPASLLDHRRCCFCHQFGDGNTDGPARLLNLDLDVWVHLNCALWSTEVYETQAGALINVELALRRGQAVRCAYCQQTGATSGCHRLRCTNVYHFTCALTSQCTFFKDKTMLCHAHRPRGTAGQALEHELRCFAVFRRVYVQRDEVRQIATAVQHPELGYTFRVGSLVLQAIGQLTPLQMATFHSTTAIFPNGYEACRIYWSMRHGSHRCRYICSVEDRDGMPEFTIRVIEQGYKDLVLTDTSPKGVWDKVLGPVAEKRTESGTLKLFPIYLKGEDLFGLTVPAVTKISESLPGVEVCERYSFRYGRNPLVELPLLFNAAGSARVQPRTNSTFSSLVIRPHAQAVSTNHARSNQNVAQGEGGAPHSKPSVVHPRSSQYRWMKSEWRANVYLARSRIQGLGLFAARDVEKQTMMIEYNGTILRNEVAIRKEKLYRSQNRELFMFRIDSEHVVDATRSGGLARYINHSCAPNCVAEVVTFERGYKIIISCLRRVEKGEELSFDYQFDTAEGHHKIACHCGAPECRKWIN
ncbi:histone-lysine N-methyltransferase 2C isoform X1 [Platichthys flesus]|uniref:histone-lysine N-methyltransferase 2C isoform X1 n=1 Tax=Platichthys flesus TaxID=8260 RepID=UPI002DB94D5E|nr:histone-lysine N-methyltransferase 2C isoform X1 [Platichthys flesus]XP_062260007.1 histone-lysine N-methyltransferase 2C isoform X1 [Platichthys flesus]